MSSPNNAPNFEDDHFDFPEPIVSGSSSPMNTTLELIKGVVLSRPFLLAIIVFLSYRLWLAPSGSKGNLLSLPGEKRSSIVPERVSVRKSQRPMNIPPVTMAAKKS